MLIKEVCEKTKLTKKAIGYYEECGLIQPVISENGYRNYSEEDVAALREIAVLRAVGMSISDIQAILKSNNKAAVLSECKFKLDMKLQKEKARLRWLELLGGHYDIEKHFYQVMIEVEGYFTIREKLSQAFPGTLGMYLSWHFGRFLNDRVDTVEQQEAYGKIVAWLDELSDFQIPNELQLLMENDFEIMQEASLALTDALVDLNSYLDLNKEALEGYLQFRTSEEYFITPAYKLQKLFADFQNRSGYQEVFIKNMKDLSPSYRKYIEQLEQANAIMLQKYPHLQDHFQSGKHPG